MVQDNADPLLPGGSSDDNRRPTTSPPTLEDGSAARNSQVTGRIPADAIPKSDARPKSRQSDAAGGRGGDSFLVSAPAVDEEGRGYVPPSVHPSNSTTQSHEGGIVDEPLEASPSASTKPLANVSAPSQTLNTWPPPSNATGVAGVAAVLFSPIDLIQLNRPVRGHDLLSTYLLHGTKGSKDQGLPSKDRGLPSNDRDLPSKDRGIPPVESPDFYQDGEIDGRPKVSTDKEWLEYIHENRDIGLFSLAYMHSGPNKAVRYYVKCLLCLILFAQLSIPFVFLYLRLSVNIFNGAFCPSGASASTRVLSCAVGCIYFAKVNMLMLDKLVANAKFRVLNETSRGGVLQCCVALDRHMSLVYTAFVYLMNLLIISLQDNHVEIVLNALAMEFIVQLDNEMKEMYLRVFNIDIESYREANNETGMKPIAEWQFRTVVLFSYYNVLMMVASLLALPVFVIWLPICKPW